MFKEVPVKTSRIRNTILKMSCLAVVVAWTPQLALAVTHDVTVGDNFFSPSSLTIQVGDTVRWNNASGGNSHNVTANDGSFASVTSSSFTFTHTFNSTGSVPYHCTIHSSSMKGTITVQSGGGGGGGGGGQPADLSLLSVSAAGGTFGPGESIAIDISIKNVGGQSSPPATIAYYASSNSSISGSDIELGTDALASLTAGETLEYTASATFPANIADGAYFIGAIIEINDASSGNDTAVDSDTITIASVSPAADLSLQLVDAPPGSYEPGDGFIVGSTVRNAGDLASGPYTLLFYASTNDSITSGDTVIGSIDRQGLEAGDQDSTGEQVTLPGSLAPGTYFIGGIIDFDDADGSNNSNVDSQPITVIESGSGFLINEGLNDAWLNTSTPGQGFFITVFPDIQKMFLAWFTFDTERPPGNISAVLGEPGHRWLTAFGPYEDDTATLAVELSQGGVFNASEPPVTQSADGTIVVKFSGCNSAMVDYDVPSAAVSGQVPIERIALDNVPFCEAQAAVR